MERLIPIFVCVFFFSQSAYCENESADGQIEEVYVSADRSLRNNQEVAVAATVFDEEQLSRGVIDNVLDIGPATPGLVTTSYNVANPQFFLRGIGSTGTSAAEESSVIVFADEGYSGRTGVAAMDYFDLERLEVLRGPQGTLFGRNAAGGVIHLITNKPSADFDGKLSFGLGSYSRQMLSGHLNGLIAGSEEVGVMGRFSFAHDKRDGFVENTITGNDNLREYDNFSGRAHLLGRFNEKASVLLTVDQSESDALAPSTRTLQSYADPLVVVGFIPLPQPNSDVHKVTLALDGPSSRESQGVKLKFTYEFDELVFESISAQRDSDYSHIEDISAAGLVVMDQVESSDLFTQEFKFSSTQDSELQWVSGIYYLKEDVDRLDVTDLSAISDAYNSLTAAGLPDNTVNYQQQAETESYAIYAQAEIPLGPKISVTIGGRYTEDHKEASLDASGADFMALGLLNAGGFSAAADKSFDRFTGKLGVNYQAAENVLSYFVYSQGYKSGGFNGIATSEESFVTPFNEEFANNYELGLKTLFFNKRLQSNIAIYQTEYEDLQVFQVQSNGNQFIDNAASATLSGVEWELSAALSSYFYSSFALSFMDNEYDEFVSIVDENADGLPDDLSGNTLTRSPEYSYSFSFDVIPPVAVGDLSIQVQYQYQDDLYTSPQNRALDKVDAFSLVNMSVVYALSDIELSVFAKNVLDEEYELHSYDADPATRGQAESTYFGDPRTFGAKLSFNF